MVGTSCSGTNAVRHGTMREWVINLTIVTPDGKILKTRQRPRKSSAGYDLTKLFIGSEGTLGVITEITLKLAVLPQEETVAVCDFPTIRDAAAVVPDLVRAGVQIGAVELLDAEMMKAINLANPDLGHAAKPTLFFKFSGASKITVEHEIQVVSEIAKKHHGGQFKYAKNQAQKEELWEGRKIALWSSTLLKPEASIWTTDVVVPVSKLPELIAETQKDIEGSFLPCPMVGHVGDGNFHVFILFDKKNNDEYKEAKRLNKNLLERAIRMEGSVTGEHGVGIGKKNFLTEELGENTVDMMKKIKIALDPKGLMNPEKVLPDN
jgi:D-lactate dehydrogenase (cytochrome)